MTERATPATVQALLQSNRESDEPEAVLAVLRAHDGKPLTKRLLAKLPGGEERWLIRQIAGMTYLDDRDHLRSRGDCGIHLLIAYRLTNVQIDAAWVEEHNASCFGARRERNERRDAAGKDPALCARMAEAMNIYAAAKAALDAAKAQLDELTDYDAAFAPDKCDWESRCGARDERK